MRSRRAKASSWATLAGEAGRFREPIPDGAGKDDLLRAAQVDQVTDAAGCNGRFDIIRRGQRSGARRRGGQVVTLLGCWLQMPASG